MSSPLSRVIGRVAYGASQLPRFAWYVGHSLALRWLSEQQAARNTARSRSRAPIPICPYLTADGFTRTWLPCSGRTSPISRPAFTRCPQITMGHC